MTTSKSPTDYQITIAQIPVQVIRKSIKNLHIGVYPPEGRVRVAAPLHFTDDNIRLAIISRLSWIKKHQAKFAAQPRQSRREMVSGETHYIFGKRYRLEVIERRGKHELKIPNSRIVQLFVNPGTSRDNRAQVLAEWYRQKFHDIIPQLLNKWQPIIGENVTDWGIKKMRTKWGSCNITQRRIWLNLELAKKPIECLEYVVVHELVHLLERYHNHRFQAYMDEYLPPWRQYRDILNREPLEDF
ncbi:SprT family zinc-dependent metalloprotease [Limnospira sp. PMC 1242.20]|uniref:M48 family metallopeptidase n=1 Tax=Limnospira sp. PMC 1242.20 TaxID=2981040 RepID=UPI0028E0F526|nr:SprT family zinc-dependent metalloprotease [Limnospira sp. PMC 1242.20]MDT9229590.1 SprT family zinc-dependent metalloprotease [Limnospira sp. PMC 1242.20]